MGRKYSWMNEQRPLIVEVLKEIERGFISAYGGTTRATMGTKEMLAAALSDRLTLEGGKERSPRSMLQAWWRWTTTASGQAAVPPLGVLASVVAEALRRNWLGTELPADMRALVDRVLEHAERPTARAPAMVDEAAAEVRRQIEAAQKVLAPKRQRRSGPG